MMEVVKGEKQYRARVNLIKEKGVETLGLATSWAWYDDPKHLLFTLARYKFIAKMLSGFENILEVGCGDGFPSRIVAQVVKKMTAIDFDPEFIMDAQKRNSEKWDINFLVWDAVEKPILGCFDGVFALDVLEHIPSKFEGQFISNIIAPLREHGVAIIGMPSIESQAHASPQSREGHVNCKTQKELKALLSHYFHNVFMFSMNDEVIHTGFPAMSHYLMAMCCGKKLKII